MDAEQFAEKQAELITRIEGVVHDILGQDGQVFVIVAHGRAATIGGTMSKRQAVAVMKHLVETLEKDLQAEEN